MPGSARKRLDRSRCHGEDVDDVQRIEAAGNLQPFLSGQLSRKEVICAHPDQEEVLTADCFPHRREEFCGKAQAPLKRPPVLVGPPVHDGGEELIGEHVPEHRHLHAVEPRADSPLSSRSVRRDDHRDLFPRYGPWDFTGALIGFVGRRQQWHPGHSARRPPPPVDELAGDECSQRMDLIGQGPEGWDNGVVPVIDVAGTSRRRRVHAGGAKNLHQGRSPARLLDVVADVAVCRQTVRPEVGVVRGADDPVLEFVLADDQRGKEARKVSAGHGCGLSRPGNDLLWADVPAMEFGGRCCRCTIHGNGSVLLPHSAPG